MAAVNASIITSSTQTFLAMQSVSNTNTTRLVSNSLGESLCFGLRFSSTANPLWDFGGLTDTVLCLLEPFHDLRFEIPKHVQNIVLYVSWTSL